MIKGAFTQQRLELLVLFSSQIAVSIENSILYNQLEVKVAERTHALQQEIVERKRAEKKAKSASKAKSDFLSNMSHELRTPLNAILGYDQILERDSTLGKEQRKEIDIISRSGRHLLSLINGVLDIAKIEAGQTILQENRFDLHAFLRVIAEMFQRQAIDNGLFFRLELEPGLIHYIKGDDGKLRQVLINLIGNALKFTKTGGITLRARFVKREKNILTLHFEVEDTGIGILPEHQKNIFTPFVQTTDGLATTASTGLGLSISRQFVQLMGGRLAVESKIDSGSIFRFDVVAHKDAPYEMKDDLKLNRVIGLAPGQPSCRILVVEDIEENRNFLVKLLRSVGFEVREAADGKQGVETFNVWHPDLIWMDMRMPVMDGYEATKRIKATDEGGNTIIIALTAHAFGDERDKVLSIGCDDFISKPYVEEELFTAMEKHLGVRFIFENQDISQLDSALPGKPTDVLTPKDLAEVPKKIKAELLEVVGGLDQKGCLAILKKLYLTHKESASALRILIENYQFEEVENILERKK
ncbi:MAG: response regulator [Candidatus Electrothrix sp. AR4]|nr:response regulator [Candidatus Electrothrix sp. AR4]